MALLKILIYCFLALLLAGKANAQPSPILPFVPVLGRSLIEVEKLLGKPRYIDSEQVRYYKPPGFVRVVVSPTPEKTLATVVFQFAPGTVKDREAALARIGARGALPEPWAAEWNVRGPSTNDELVLTRRSDPPPTSEAPPHVVLTRHALERMQERGVSQAQAEDLIKNGRRFYDPKNDSYIHWKDGVYVALTKDGVLKTVVRGAISKRWQPLE